MRSGLAKFSAWFYEHKITAGIGFLLIVGLGLVSFTSLLDREGFPSIQFPLVIVNGSYFVDDQAQVDEMVTEPFSDAFTELENVSEVQTGARDNSFNATVFFDESTTPVEGLDITMDTVAGLDLPEQVQLSYTPIDPSGFLYEYSALIAVYDPAENLSLEQLEQEAQTYVEQLEQRSEIESASIQSLFSTGVNPATQEQITQQTSFSSVGIDRSDDQLSFNQNVIIGVKSSDQADVLELSAAIEQVLDENSQNSETEAVIGADFATQLETQISSLQTNLLTGIVAVALMSLLLISRRSSIITGLFIVSVIFSTFAVMLGIGYSINTITLFALVLALGLFVDDATIIVEAIDSEKKKSHGNTRPLKIIKTAIKKVGLASLSGTLTTVFVFLPLAFVSGVLGEFIRALPITVVVALLVSYLLSLSFIPFGSRYTIFTTDSKRPAFLDWISDQVERIASVISGLILRAKTGMMIGFIILSVVLVALGGVFVGRAGFNIFPSAKDANQLVVEIEFKTGNTIDESEVIAGDINNVLQQEKFDQHITGVLYGGFNGANARQADATIDLVPYSDRDKAAPIISKQLQTELNEMLGDRAEVSVGQIDAGPPAADFPFRVQLYGERDDTLEFAAELNEFLSNEEFELATGGNVKITDTQIQLTDSIVRSNGRQFVQVVAAFDSDQTTAALEAAEADTKDFVEEQDLKEYGLSASDVEYDYGQESENAESFAALGLVFPIAIGAMAVLLMVQFRSFVQPLLIFLAIPFGFTGAFVALDATNNPLSFFSAVGLIGLTGIAVNNSILLIDYANQERAKGASPRKAIANATDQRFRPLLATSLTTIVALLPLAIYDPFWQPLAVAIIGGLISSTLLVVICLPYYYLATERARVAIKNWWRQVLRN
jgi:multidrug efflux pump subunit AcrB